MRICNVHRHQRSEHRHQRSEHRHQRSEHRHQRSGHPQRSHGQHSRHLHRSHGQHSHHLRSRGRRSHRSHRSHHHGPILTFGRARFVRRFPCRTCKTSTSWCRRFPPHQEIVHEAVRSTLRQLTRLLRLQARGTSR